MEYKTGSVGLYKSVASYEPFYRVNWSGVFAGTIVALVTGVALDLLGMGIGLGAGIGAGIWMVGSVIVALFVGGWVSSRTTGYMTPLKGVFQGIFTWCLFTLGTIALTASSAGTHLFSFIGITASTPEVVSRVAIWGFITMVLSFIAASLGGRLGVAAEYIGAVAGEHVEEKEEKEVRKAA